MTPGALARLHREAMEIPGPWSERSFAEMLAMPGVFLVTSCPSSCQKYAGEREGQRPSPGATTQSAQQLRGFALGRVVLDEAEVLTLAVDTNQRRQGIGRACLAEFEASARQRGALTGHLEVAESNFAARALYRAMGWRQIGCRKAYYALADRQVDAILLSKPLRTD